MLGEHTAEVLAGAGLLGEEEIAAMEESGAVARPGRRPAGVVHDMSAQPASDNGLLRMGELAEASGVSAGTIKHYLREGLLPEPVKTSRNMSWYPPEFVERIRLIKQLQEERFMPLKAIKSVLDSDPSRARALVELEDRILERALLGRRQPHLRAPRSSARYEMPARGARPARADRAAHARTPAATPSSTCR